MRLKSIYILLCLGAALSGRAATLNLYHNQGIKTNEVVDAYNFLNEGDFFVTPFIAPWDAQNTTNWVNRGLMSGLLGFRFDTVIPPFGFRSQALNFVNEGTILAQDAGGSLTFIDGEFIGGFFSPDVSYVNINARSINNFGDISVGASGLIKLTARNVNLTGGTLFVENVDSALSSGLFGVFVDDDGQQFLPSAGVHDLAWGVGIDTNMPIDNIVVATDPNFIITPDFNITNYFGVWCRGISLFTTNSLVFVREAAGIGGTNLNIQVVNVVVADTNISVHTSFLPQVIPQGDPQGGYFSPLVEFRYSAIDFRTLTPLTNSFYVFSQLGSQTNYNLAFNTIDRTYRPGALAAFRGPPGIAELFGAPPDRTFIEPDIFSSTIYSNRIATNQYAAYSLSIDSLARRLPPLPDVGVTNMPGRVEINTDSLELYSTRIRGEGLVSLKATNVTALQDTTIDVTRLNLSLNTRSNVLTVPKLTEDFVQRFGGLMQVHSAIWTNAADNPATPDTNDFIEVRFELLTIDATQLHTREPVITHELRLVSTNNGAGQIIFDANFAVTNVLEIRAQDLTFGPQSRLFLAKGIEFSTNNVINVNNLTNLGQIQLNELADWRVTGSFVNRSNLIAFGHLVNTPYFENSGNIISSNNFIEVLPGDFDCFGMPTELLTSEITQGVISINAEQAKIDGGQFYTLGDIEFNGVTYKINNHQAFAGRTLFLNVTGTLADSGIGTGNDWEVARGFRMEGPKPAGDLLGTELTTFAANQSFVDHVWAGEDRGPVVAGFTNNVALGKLTLLGQTNATFRFRGADGNNAIYVDVLEIDGILATNLNAIRQRVILNGIDIYYGDVQSTNANITAESLNRLFGPTAPFNFHWVTNYAGPRSGIDVPLTPTGPVARFNRALRQSINIDSDEDGIPNGFDPFPFPSSAFFIGGAAFNPATTTVSFGFQAEGNARYQIEYTTNLGGIRWSTLKEVLQTNPAGGRLTVTDTVKANAPQRYYRVRRLP